MSLQIRFAVPEDFTTVRLLDPHSKFIDPQRIKHKLEAKEIILAFDQDLAIGLIKFSYIWATRPFIDLIWVAKEHRQQGVGKQLLNFLSEFLKEHGHVYLLSSSEKSELTPQQWHQRQGFIPCGELTGVNLPQENTPEVFFYKRLVSNQLQTEKLREFPVI